MLSPVKEGEVDFHVGAAGSKWSVVACQHDPDASVTSFEPTGLTAFLDVVHRLSAEANRKKPNGATTPAFCSVDGQPAAKTEPRPSNKEEACPEPVEFQPVNIFRSWARHS